LDVYEFFSSLCDEATSALDSTTEAAILNSLKTLSEDRTSIFIAHRLTTAMQCDEVLTFVLLETASFAPFCTTKAGGAPGFL
jgi:ATP-binding cassette, subfamily B (MDR/TAP), member 7